jgi:hypothetical protein
VVLRVETVTVGRARVKMHRIAFVEDHVLGLDADNQEALKHVKEFCAAMLMRGRRLRRLGNSA